MTRVEQARIRARQGDAEGALALLEAGDGDPACWMELGWWHLQARGVPRDLARSRACFARAARLGDAQGRAIYIALLANGTGGPADFAGALRLLAEAAASDPAPRRQYALIDAMELTPHGDPRTLPEPRSLCDRPWIRLFPRLFTPDECRYLADAAVPAYRPAHVGETATGRLSYNAVRTCDTAGFPWIAEDPAIHALNRRLAAASGTAVECGEPLQVLRYRPGQEFRPHRDCTEAGGNQRILTMLVYLNSGYQGGETLFLKPGLAIRGEIGDALLFRNVDAQGRPDPESLHAGLPVTAGEKRVASRWIREKPFGPIAK